MLSSSINNNFSNDSANNLQHFVMDIKVNATSHEHFIISKQTFVGKIKVEKCRLNG